jgi:hypothetical protein
MYLYDQGRTSSVALGIGQLDAFGKSPNKKTAQDLAEAKRLEDEMAKLDAKGNWSGVDRTYENWLKVYDETDINKWPIHQKAACAAMKLGKAGTRYMRLWSALQLLKRDNRPLEERDKMEKEKKQLGDEWVHVIIRLTRGSEASVVPNALNWPLEGGSEAIKFAEETLGKERVHSGLLPLGTYTISGQWFQFGIDWAWSRVWYVLLNQKKDGSFSSLFYPREPTSEADPPLHLR